MCLSSFLLRTYGGTHPWGGCPDTAHLGVLHQKRASKQHGLVAVLIVPNQRDFYFAQAFRCETRVELIYQSVPTPSNESMPTATHKPLVSILSNKWIHVFLCFTLYLSAVYVSYSHRFCKTNLYVHFYFECTYVFQCLRFICNTRFLRCSVPILLSCCTF